MSRRKFIESNNATYKNWNWSWSFVNHDQKIIIFGAWDTHTNGECALIFSEDWKHRKRKPPAFDESLSHIRLIENKGYELKTFVIIKNEYRDKNGNYKSKIKSFIKKLEIRKLQKIGANWYANGPTNKINYESEFGDPNLYSEGSIKKILVNSYERSKNARQACLNYHGYRCLICDIDLGEKYGDIAEGLIHVHHKIPISEIAKNYQLDPINDLIPVCPNCHAVIHRTKPALTIAQIKELIGTNHKLINN